MQTGREGRKFEEQLFSRYEYFIREGILKYSITEDQAFDAYSDTILAAINKIRENAFEGRAILKTWLFQIFQNRCVDLIRKSTTNKSSIHRTLSMTDLMLEVTDSARSIVQQLMDKADRDLIREKLNHIGDSCREILLQWAEGISDKEIAADLDYKTADVVKTSRLRCLEKLRKLYKIT